MTYVAEANIVPIAIAVLVGLIAAWWSFRSFTRQSGQPGEDAATPAAPPPAPPRERATRDGREGNRLQDEVAAATTDVAGEIIGVRAHAELPGASGPPNDLQMLKGVGPRLAAQLNAAGITRFDQLAGLNETEVALLDARMGAFEGRVVKDRLVEQACYLARDDRDGFEAKFGKLGGEA
jgi:predicted flap endonuclease-1-like 5' DNA nuclease